MSQAPRHLPYSPASHRRVLLGVAISASDVAAVRVAATGTGLEARLELLQSTTRDLPPDLARSMAQLVSGAAAPQEAARVAAGLGQVAAGAVLDVASSGELREVLALGLTDPGLWHCDGATPASCQTLCDAAQVAEATGLTVVDAFATRDLVQGGAGGPLAALPQWMLWHDAKKPRVLVDLGRTTRLTYLPASYEARGAERVMAIEVGPGTRLLDRLTREMTKGRETIDHGGRFAVQGRHLPPLIEHLLAGPPQNDTQPRWHPQGVPVDWHFDESIRLAVANGWSMCDLLCSANAFIAESIRRVVLERVPKSPPLQQMVVSGGGAKNGLLRRELDIRLADLELVMGSDLGVRPEQVDATCAATLALLHLLQVPASHTFTTGAAVSRVLGRLTPGSPQNWQRVVKELAANTPAVMSLRSAI